MKSLQTLRALCFLGILSLHCGMIDYGSIGVSVFFVLSGFLVAYSYKPAQSLREEIEKCIRRILRIYPLYFVSMLACALLEANRIHVTSGVLEIKVLLVDLLTNALMLQAWIPDYERITALNSPSWFMSSISFMWFVFAFIRFSVTRRGIYFEIQETKAKCGEEQKRSDPNVCASKIVICSVMLFVIQVAWSVMMRASRFAWYNYFFPIYRSFDFFQGCNLAMLILARKMELAREDSNEKMGTTAYEIITLAVAIVLPIIVQTGSIQIEWLDTRCLIYQPISLALVFFFFRSGGHIVRFLQETYLTKLGDVSPSLYLLHYVILCYFQALYRKLTGEYMKQGLLLFVIVLILSIGLAKIWELVIEITKRNSRFKKS